MIGKIIGALAPAMVKKVTNNTTKNKETTKPKYNEHQQYIEDNNDGGYNAYVSNQNARYADALKNNNVDLLNRLNADAQRVGYTLNAPETPTYNLPELNLPEYKPYSGKLPELNLPEYKPYSGKLPELNLPSLNLPTLELPDYEKFTYKDFDYRDFNYDDFKYNVNDDKMYNVYKDMYGRQGQAASDKALANTAAATGGMPSSYAAAANAQAQQAYAKKTADMIPILEDKAYNRYANERGFAYGQYSDDRNFNYQDYLGDRDLAHNEHQNDYQAGYGKALDLYGADYNSTIDKYNADYSKSSDMYNADWQNVNFNYQDNLNKYNAESNNAQKQYDANWNNINYTDSRNDLQYDRKFQQEQFDYQKYLNDLDENYRQDTFDWNKTTDERDYNRGVYADDRNYNYNSGQDAIRNSISWANQGLSKQRFEYDKTQDELARQDKEEQSKREKYQQDLDVNYPNTVMGQLEERTRQAQEEEKANSIRAAVSSAMQAPNAADWLRENASVMNDEEYASVMKILKDYGALKKQGE